LALYGWRVRSNEVLEGTTLSSPKSIQSLGTTSLALRAQPWHSDRRELTEADAQDAAARPAAQHRYLNHRIPRFSWLDRGLGRPGTEALTGLEIYLGGSLKLSRRSVEAGSAYLDHRHSWGAAW